MLNRKREVAVHYVNEYIKKNSKSASNATLLDMLKTYDSRLNHYVRNYAEFCDLAKSLAHRHDDITSPPCTSLKYALAVQSFTGHKSVPTLPDDVDNLRFLTAKFTEFVQIKKTCRINWLVSTLVNHDNSMQSRNITKKAYRKIRKREIDIEDLLDFVGKTNACLWINSYNDFIKLIQRLNHCGYPVINSDETIEYRFYEACMLVVSKDDFLNKFCKIEIPDDIRRRIIIDTFNRLARDMQFFREGITTQRFNFFFEFFLTNEPIAQKMIKDYDDAIIIVNKINSDGNFVGITMPLFTPEAFAQMVYKATSYTDISNDEDLKYYIKLPQSVTAMDLLTERFKLSRLNLIGQNGTPFQSFLKVYGVLKTIGSFDNVCLLADRLRQEVDSNIEDPRLTPDPFVRIFIEHSYWNIASEPVHMRFLPESMKTAMLLNAYQAHVAHHIAVGERAYTDATLRQFLSAEGITGLTSYASFIALRNAAKELPGSQISSKVFRTRRKFVRFVLDCPTFKTYDLNIELPPKEKLAGLVAVFTRWYHDRKTTPGLPQCLDDTEAFVLFFDPLENDSSFQFVKTYQEVCAFAVHLNRAGFKISYPPMQRSEYNAIARERSYYGLQYAWESLTERTAGYILQNQGMFAKHTPQQMAFVKSTIERIGTSYAADREEDEHVKAQIPTRVRF